MRSKFKLKAKFIYERKLNNNIIFFYTTTNADLERRIGQILLENDFLGIIKQQITNNSYCGLFKRIDICLPKNQTRYTYEAHYENSLKNRADKINFWESAGLFENLIENTSAWRLGYDHDIQLNITVEG